jgi:hypothetical protein
MSVSTQVVRAAKAAAAAARDRAFLLRLTPYKQRAEKKVKND